MPCHLVLLSTSLEKAYAFLVEIFDCFEWMNSQNFMASLYFMCLFEESKNRNKHKASTRFFFLSQKVWLCADNILEVWATDSRISQNSKIFSPSSRLVFANYSLRSWWILWSTSKNSFSSIIPAHQTVYFLQYRLFPVVKMAQLSSLSSHPSKMMVMSKLRKECSTQRLGNTSWQWQNLWLCFVGIPAAEYHAHETGKRLAWLKICMNGNQGPKHWLYNRLVFKLGLLLFLFVFDQN